MSFFPFAFEGPIAQYAFERYAYTVTKAAGTILRGERPGAPAKRRR